MEDNNLNLSNQENVINENNNQKNENNNKNVLIVLMALIIVGLAGYIGYTKFIQKPDTDTSKDNDTQEKDNNNQQTDNTNKEKDNNNQQTDNTNKEKDNNNQQTDNTNKEKDNGTQDNKDTSQNIYKTSDGKFTLKVVDKNDQNAKLAFNNDNFEETEIKYYAYFNDVVLIITDVMEDEHYAMYSFAGYANAEANGYSLIVNKDKKILEINPVELENKHETCMNSNFCDFSHHQFYVKTDSGYFFGVDSEGEGLVRLYTTEWKKLGYVYLDHSSNDYRLKESDSTGVVTYINFTDDCDENGCTYNLLNPVKYDSKGNNASGSDIRFVTQLVERKISNNNQSIKFKNASINVKTNGNDLYVNDKKIYSSNMDDTHSGYTLYYNEKSDYALITDDYDNMCNDGLFVGAINSKGEFVKTETKSVDGHEHDMIACVATVFMKNDKYYITYIGDNFGLEYGGSFSYDKEIIIK